MPFGQLEFFGTQYLAEFFIVISAKPTLFLFTRDRVERVGILRREKSAMSVSHFVKDVIQRFTSGTSKIILTIKLMSLKQRDRDQRLVVEHLFKMRNHPRFIDRVAVKSSVQLIIDSPTHHMS